MNASEALQLPEDVLARLRAGRRTMVLTGAGISAESGIATFRAPNTGLWSQFDPQKLASPEGWQRDPKLVWGWYAYRRLVAKRAQPNAGHLALVRLADYYDRLTIVTQNVDGLHTQAGSRDIVEMHGNIARVRCAAEGTLVEYADPEDPAYFEALERGDWPKVPTCRTCGALLRPDVVWFGELLPGAALARANEAAAQCDVCLVVGTTALVYPAGDLPRAARLRGACLIEINPEPTELSERADLWLRAPAGRALPWLVDQIAATAL